MFPLGFTRQSRAFQMRLCRSPSGEGVGLEVIDVTDWRVGIDGHHTVQGKSVPLPIALFPVERGGDLIRLHPVPTHREPQFRARVALVGDECSEVAMRHRIRCKFKRLDKNLMSWALIIESQSRSDLVNVEPDRNHPATIAHPAGFTALNCGQWPTVLISGLQRVFR